MKKTYYLTMGILLLLVTSLSPVISQNTTTEEKIQKTPETPVVVPDVYTPTFNAHNVKEQMTLSPLFTPDNAIDWYVYWIDRANDSIVLQNQYIRKFDSGSWSSDSNPIVRAIVDANQSRGVNVRVQVNDDDKDNVAGYLMGLGMEVRFMGTSSSAGNNDYLSATHNKLVIIDGKISIISSINFSENAFKNNREAGMVIENQAVSQHWLNIFDADWAVGEIPSPAIHNLNPSNDAIGTHADFNFTSHTNIPRQNFTGSYNVTAFTNPDNANDVIFDYLNSAQQSIYVSMYTISRQDFVDTLVNLKNNDPSLDIQVLISNRRVGASENEDTADAVDQLTDALIPVYNSTKDDDKVDGFYHNKYWIIDQKHTFIYSGNWSPRSVADPDDLNSEGEFTSGEVNRDMGIAVANAPDIADFIKSEVWDKDVAVGDAYELPAGITQTSFSIAEVVDDEVTLAASISGLTNAQVSYRFGTSTFTDVTLSGSSFSLTFDTSSIGNGVQTFEVKAVADQGTFTDAVDVNVVNIPESDNWRVLITELLPNPEGISDSDGEFIELTNSFPFGILLEGWKLGDDSNLYTFSDGYTIPAYSSFILASSDTAFENEFQVAPDAVDNIGLVNGGDFAQLQSYDGSVIDAVAYGDATAPDGSEVLGDSESGLSFMRSPMHVDTDTASDWTTGSPDPKGDVPEISLGETADDAPTDLTDVPIIISVIPLALVIIPLMRRKL